MDKVLQEHERFGGERKEDAGKGGERPFRVVAVEQLNESENVGDDINRWQDAIEDDVQECLSFAHHLSQLWISLEESWLLAIWWWRRRFGAGTTTTTSPAGGRSAARHRWISV